MKIAAMIIGFLTFIGLVILIFRWPRTDKLGIHVIVILLFLLYLSVQIQNWHWWWDK